MLNEANALASEDRLGFRINFYERLVNVDFICVPAVYGNGTIAFAKDNY